MQLILYKTNDADNVINKTLLAPLPLDINLRKHNDINSPELVLKFSNSILDYNYCEIVELERFYFIDSIESINRQLWKIRLSTDVLETFKNEIMQANNEFMVSDYSGLFGDVEFEGTGLYLTDYLESDTKIIDEANYILSVRINK